MRAGKLMALVGLAACVALAQEGPPPMGMERPGGGKGMERHPGFDKEKVERMMVGALIKNERVRQEIGVTDEQVEQLKKAQFDHERRVIELRYKQELAGLKQAELMTQESPDEKALMAAVEEVGKHQTDFAKLQVEQLLTLKKILNPEQQAKIREMVRKQCEERFRREGGPGREKMTGPEGREFRGHPEGPEGEERRGEMKRRFMEERERRDKERDRDRERERREREEREKEAEPKP